MTKFPDEKHFGSWLGLALKVEISGGSVLKNNTLNTKNRAEQNFCMAAQSVKQTDIFCGSLYRYLKLWLDEV